MSFERDTIPITLASNLVSQPPGDFTMNFSQTLRLDVGVWKVALTNLAVWNTAYNISAALGNNTMTIFNPIPVDGTPGGETQLLTFPDGVYNGTDIIDALNTFLVENSAVQNPPVIDSNGVFTPLFLSLDTVQLKFIMNFDTTTGFRVYLNDGSLLYQLLGFDAAEYTVTTTAQEQANISNGVSAYFVRVNCLDGNFTLLNGNASDIIYSYTPNEPPGSLITYTPTFPIFIRTSGAPLQSVRVYITDQLGRVVNLNGGASNQNNPTTVTLTFIRTDKNNGQLADD